MRANEFINEVKMSPTSLEKMSANIDARVGFEFEVYVPDERYLDYDDYESEPDMSYDSRVNYISDITEFFRDSNDIDEIGDDLNERFQLWVYDKIDNDFAENRVDICKSYIKDRYSENEILFKIIERDLLSEYGIRFYDTRAINRIMNIAKGNLDDQKYQQIYDEIMEDYDDLLTDYVKLLIDEHDEGEDETNTVESAWDEYRESKVDILDRYESDFLESIGIERLSDVYNSEDYNVFWPHETDVSTEELIYSTLASEMSALFGKETKWATDYHGVRRGDWYVVESDGSLQSPPRLDYTGIEIVTPTPPPFLNDSLEVLEKFHHYANENDFRTNRSTGLHISVSVPNLDQLDPLKLILFMGDRYVLDKFDRKSARYAESVFDKLTDLAYRGVPQQDMIKIFDSLRKGYAKFALDSIGLYLNRQVSANITRDRVEFRGPGNDWLNQDVSTIINAVRRFAVSLSIACDPELYKNEYAKKLYTVLTRYSDKDSTIELFSRYSSGLLPQSAFKSLLKSKTPTFKGVDAGTHYIVVDDRHLDVNLNWEEMTAMNKQIPTVSELKILRNTKRFGNSTSAFWSSDIDTKTKRPLVFNMYTGQTKPADTKQEYQSMFIIRYPKK